MKWNCRFFWTLQGLGSRSQVPSPKSQVPSPKSKVQSPKSKVSSLKSQVSSPKSQVPSLKSQVPSPKSQVSSPKSQVARRIFPLDQCPTAKPFRRRSAGSKKRIGFERNCPQKPQRSPPRTRRCFQGYIPTDGKSPQGRPFFALTHFQPLADTFRHCKGKVMSQRLAQAVREAEQRGLLGFTEAEALKKEFPL